MVQTGGLHGREVHLPHVFFVSQKVEARQEGPLTYSPHEGSLG